MIPTLNRSLGRNSGRNLKLLRRHSSPQPAPLTTIPSSAMPTKSISTKSFNTSPPSMSIMASESALPKPPGDHDRPNSKTILDYLLENCAKHPKKVFLTQPMGSHAGNIVDSKNTKNPKADILKEWTFEEFLSESKKMASFINDQVELMNISRNDSNGSKDSNTMNDSSDGNGGLVPSRSNDETDSTGSATVSIDIDSSHELSHDPEDQQPTTKIQPKKNSTSTRPIQIAILSKNCAHWLMADLAIMLSGHVSVPIYPTLTAETTRYTLEHSETKMLFVGKLDEKPWKEMKKGVMEYNESVKECSNDGSSLKCVSFPFCPEGLDADFDVEKWENVVNKCDEIEEVVERKPEEMATIIYTSGSTGRPKGVMISFQAMTTTTQGFIRSLNITSSDRYLSYLPLSHGMERWLGECIPYVSGCHVFYSESLSAFSTDMKRCRPTIFVSVPRLWTKFQQGVFKNMDPKTLERWMKVPIVKGFMKKKILKSLGLDCTRVAASGSAPLAPEVLGWYRELGLELLEGYGMTENFNYSHLSQPGRARIGYVGEPYPDVSQRIDPETSEIQIQSPGLMMGYFKNPTATSETITPDGWLKTGDKGSLDSMGRLKITGRTKEIFKTAKGKYVAPAPIESQYVAHPWVELACVGGRGWPMAHAIVLLGEEAKKTIQQGVKEYKDKLENEMATYLDLVNQGLDEHEKLQFMAIVNEEWLPENGFVTPTNKMQRSKIEEEHAPMLEEWYASKKKVIWYRW